jgi:hypothetical protein
MTVALSFITSSITWLVTSLGTSNGQSVIRSVFKILGGMLVAKGWFSADFLDAILGLISASSGLSLSASVHSSTDQSATGAQTAVAV